MRHARWHLREYKDSPMRRRCAIAPFNMNFTFFAQMK
jgi:hypothetical protein